MILQTKMLLDENFRDPLFYCQYETMSIVLWRFLGKFYPYYTENNSKKLDCRARRRRVECCPIRICFRRQHLCLWRFDLWREDEREAHTRASPIVPTISPVYFFRNGTLLAFAIATKFWLAYSNQNCNIKENIDNKPYHSGNKRRRNPSV